MSWEHAFQLAFALLSVIATAVANDARSSLKEAHIKIAKIELDLVANYVSEEKLEKIFDEKLKPLTEAINRITAYIEANSGWPAIRPRV